MTQITTSTTLPSDLHPFGGQAQGGYQAFHLAQPGFPVWGVLVLAVAVSAVALAGIVILRRRQQP
jgi:hypothetical protein